MRKLLGSVQQVFYVRNGILFNFSLFYFGHQELPQANETKKGHESGETHAKTPLHQPLTFPSPFKPFQGSSSLILKELQAICLIQHRTKHLSSSPATLDWNRKKEVTRAEMFWGFYWRRGTQTHSQAPRLETLHGLGYFNSRVLNFVEEQPKLRVIPKSRGKLQRILEGCALHLFNWLLLSSPIEILTLQTNLIVSTILLFI